MFLLLPIGEKQGSNRNCFIILISSVLGAGILSEHGDATTGLADTELTEDELEKLTDVERADLEFANITEAERANLENTDVEHMVIKREADRIALIRQENAARTPYEFEKLVGTYINLP